MKNDPHWTSVSQWLRKEVVLDLMDKKLSATYEKWFDEKAWDHLQATYRKKRRR